MSIFKEGDKVRFTGGVSLDGNTGALIDLASNASQAEWFLKQDSTGYVICRFESELELIEGKENERD